MGHVEHHTSAQLDHTTYGHIISGMIKVVRIVMRETGIVFGLLNGLLKNIVVHASMAIAASTMFAFNFLMGISDIKESVAWITPVLVVTFLAYYLTSLLPIVVLGIFLLAYFGKGKEAFGLTAVSMVYAFFNAFLM